MTQAPLSVVVRRGAKLALGPSDCKRGEVANRTLSPWERVPAGRVRVDRGKGRASTLTPTLSRCAGEGDGLCSEQCEGALSESRNSNIPVCLAGNSTCAEARACDKYRAGIGQDSDDEYQYSSTTRSLSHRERVPAGRVRVDRGIGIASTLTPTLSRCAGEGDRLFNRHRVDALAESCTSKNPARFVGNAACAWSFSCNNVLAATACDSDDQFQRFTTSASPSRNQSTQWTSLTNATSIAEGLEGQRAIPS
jgi:hypothetical protein